jgi:hypothetical protein
MILTDKQLEYIDTNLLFYGVTSKPLREDLLDHICSHIEASNSDDFEMLYNEALNKFGGYYSLKGIQRETNFQLYFNKKIRLKRVIFFSGFLVAVLFTIGSLFKIMHWPYASFILLSAFVIFSIIFLPFLFYSTFKKSIQKLT